MRQEHILRFQVTMNDFVTFQKNETTQKLLSKTSDELQ